MSETEAPYEMVNLVPRMTGLPMTVWASPRGQARHRAQPEPAPGLDPGVRIKVNPTHGAQMIIRDAVTVAVRPRRTSSPAHCRRQIVKPSSNGSR